MAIEGFRTRSVGDSAALMDAFEGADLGSPNRAPPLGRGFMAAITRPPGRLRIGGCDATVAGQPVHPDCAQSVRNAARLLRDMGHEGEPFRAAADHEGMIRAWVDIVAAGTAL